MPSLPPIKKPNAVQLIEAPRRVWIVRVVENGHTTNIRHFDLERLAILAAKAELKRLGLAALTRI
jgi:hypothetical protein